MHYYTIIGIILITLGTFLLYWGGSIQNKKESTETREIVEQKIESVLEKVDDIKSSSEQPQKQKLEEVKNEFSEWAKLFLSSREERELEYSKKNVHLREKELEYHQKLAPIYEYLHEEIISFIKAYNEISSDNIKYDSYDYPSNLYKTHFKNTIEFSPKLHWIITYRGDPPASETSLPKFTINSVDPQKGLISNFGFITFRPDYDLEHIKPIIDGKAFSKAKLPNIVDVDNYRKEMTKIAKSLVEIQLHQLGK